ncbi:hypothetical protein [Paracandidimonas soli]|nr:hypothetical protein [Paracandidimonas soli]
MHALSGQGEAAFLRDRNKSMQVLERDMFRQAIHPALPPDSLHQSKKTIN